MKLTSLKANQKADKTGLKLNHKRKILKALDMPLNGKEIALKSGLDYHSVMRRMLELQNENKVIVDGVKNGYTVYKLK